MNNDPADSPINSVKHITASRQHKNIIYGIASTLGKNIAFIHLHLDKNFTVGEHALVRNRSHLKTRVTKSCGLTTGRCPKTKIDCICICECSGTKGGCSLIFFKEPHYKVRLIQEKTIIKKVPFFLSKR